MEIRIPLISYGRVELIEGDYETLEFCDGYVRMKGRYKCKEPKDWEDIDGAVIDRVKNYDFVCIKSHISCYGKRFLADDDIWSVFIDLDDESTFSFKYRDHKPAKELYDKIHRWYFEGIAE